MEQQLLLTSAYPYYFKLAYVYDENRELNKRTGKPLQKKPAYRMFAKGHEYYPARSNSLGEVTITGMDFKLHGTGLDSELVKNRALTVLVPQEVWDEMFNKEVEEKVEEITLSQMNLADFEDRFIEPPPPTLWSRFKSALSKLF